MILGSLLPDSCEAQREYYKPYDIVEEILVQKIVVETARYGRVLAFERNSRLPEKLTRTFRVST